MSLLIELQIALEKGDQRDIPPESQFQCWVDAVADTCQCSDKSLSIRLVGVEESAQLNARYRNKNGATNVLSFPFENPPGVDVNILGDLAICAPVVKQEAMQQNKSAEAHWAHILIHGILHLCGYDHLEDMQAEEMEALETRIITGLGYPPPYEEVVH